MDEFKAGDRVYHRAMQEPGTVDCVNATGVYVTYDRTAARGRNWTGIYDDLWFRLHPDGLVHEQKRKECIAGQSSSWRDDGSGNPVRTIGE